MSSEWSAVPRHVLSDDLDSLLDERDDLTAQSATAYHLQIEAEKAIAPAIATDRAAYATALRIGISDPGATHETQATTAFESAKRTLEATRAALVQNQTDLVSLVDTEGPVILGSLQEQAQTVRVAALSLLEELSKSLDELRGYQALMGLIARPLLPNGESLRRFSNDQPLRVAFANHRDEPATAAKMLEAIGRVLVDGASPGEYMLAAYSAGLKCDRVERIATGALKWARNTVPNINSLNLVRYRIVRGGYATDLLVSVEHDEANDLATILKANRQNIEEGFAHNKRYVAGDAGAVASLESLAPKPERLIIEPRLPEPEPIAA